MSAIRQGRLLLVEDEHVLRELVAQFLRGEGYEVAVASDGGEGVERYTRHGPFEVVLLDLNLPILSGVDVCRQIRQIVPEQPVLICSAAILDSHISALNSLGVDQFLSKPYHPMELTSRIRLLAGKFEQERTGQELTSRTSWRKDIPHALSPNPATRSLFKSPAID